MNLFSTGTFDTRGKEREERVKCRQFKLNHMLDSDVLLVCNALYRDHVHKLARAGSGS